MKANLFSKSPEFDKVSPHRAKLYYPDTERSGKKTFSSFVNKSPDLTQALKYSPISYIRKSRDFVTLDQLQAYDAPWAGQKRNSPFSQSQVSAGTLRTTGNQIINQRYKEDLSPTNDLISQSDRYISQDEADSQFQQKNQFQKQSQDLYKNDQYSNQLLDSVDHLIDSRFKILEDQKKKLQEIKNQEENLYQQRTQRQQEIDKIIKDIEALQEQRNPQNMSQKLYNTEGIQIQRPQIKIESSSQLGQTINLNNQQKSKKIQSGPTQEFHEQQDPFEKLKLAQSLEFNMPSLASLAEMRKVKYLLPKSGNKINLVEYNPENYKFKRFSKGSQKGYKNTNELIL